MSIFLVNLRRDILRYSLSRNYEEKITVRRILYVTYYLYRVRVVKTRFRFDEKYTSNGYQKPRMLECSLDYARNAREKERYPSSGRSLKSKSADDFIIKSIAAVAAAEHSRYLLSAFHALFDAVPGNVQH